MRAIVCLVGALSLLAATTACGCQTSPRSSGVTIALVPLPSTAEEIMSRLCVNDRCVVETISGATVGQIEISSSDVEGIHDHDEVELVLILMSSDGNELFNARGTVQAMSSANCAGSCTQINARYNHSTGSLTELSVN